MEHVSGNGNEVAVGGPGDVFIAGQTSYLVQCYDATNGSVTVVAGTVGRPGARGARRPMWLRGNRS